MFEGRVTKLVEPPARTAGEPTLSVELTVVQAWKGVEHERFVLHTPVGAATCGYAFARDEVYLVYAVERGSVPWVDRCSRTRAVTNASEDLAALGLGVTPVDIEPEAEAGAHREPPARGGCAGCALGEAPPRTRAAGLAWLGGLALWLVARRRRSAGPHPVRSYRTIPRR